VAAATVVDHIQPHHGDWSQFLIGGPQSLCADCHNSSKKFVESRGYDSDIGLDGWPIDPRHPCRKGR
jgi:hypothetical protein